MTFAEFLAITEKRGRRCWSLSTNDDGDEWILIVNEIKPGIGHQHRAVVGPVLGAVLECGASCPLRIPNTEGDTPLRVTPAPRPRVAIWSEDFI